MNQGSPRADAATASPTRSTPVAILVRLLIALVIGLVTPAHFFTANSASPVWMQAAITTALLALAAVVGISLDTQLHRGTIARRRVGRGVIASVVVIAALGGGFIATRLLQATESPSTKTGAAISILGSALTPLLIGLVAGIVAQRAPSAKMSLGGATLAWLAAAPVNVILVYVTVFAPGSQSAEPGTEFTIAIAVNIIGFGIAFFGGLLGWGLRALAARGAA